MKRRREERGEAKQRVPASERDASVVYDVSAVGSLLDEAAQREPRPRTESERLLVARGRGQPSTLLATSTVLHCRPDPKDPNCASVVAVYQRAIASDNPTLYDKLDHLYLNREEIEDAEGQAWDQGAWWKDDPEPDAEFTLWDLAQFLADLEMDLLKAIFKMDPKPNPVPVYLALSFASRFERDVPGWASKFLSEGGNRLREAELTGDHGDCRGLLDMEASDHMRRYLRYDKRVWTAFQVRFMEIHHLRRDRHSANRRYSKAKIKRIMEERTGWKTRTVENVSDLGFLDETD